MILNGIVDWTQSQCIIRPTPHADLLIESLSDGLCKKIFRNKFLDLYVHWIIVSSELSYLENGIV